MANDKIKISSCFMHFDGVKEPLCKISRQRLKKFVECRPKYAKLYCEQADIVKNSYSLFEDSSINSYFVKDDENFHIEWYHHMKCYKKFCDEEKIRRQEKKERKCTNMTNIAVPLEEKLLMAPMEPRRKVTRNSCAQSSKDLPQKCCIICGKDSSWFSRDKV